MSTEGFEFAWQKTLEQIERDRSKPQPTAELKPLMLALYEQACQRPPNENKLDKAIQAYEEVVRKWPDGAYASTASRRLEDLNREETKAFYDKFAAFDPQPAPSGGPSVPGSPPSFDSESLPSEASFPDLLGSQGPDDSESEPAAPEDSSATMQPEETVPAEPGEETPAAEPGPSEEASASCLGLASSPSTRTFRLTTWWSGRTTPQTGKQWALLCFCSRRSKGRRNYAENDQPNILKGAGRMYHSCRSLYDNRFRINNIC